LAACGSQPAPFEKDESSTTPAQEELSPIDSPTNLADAGADLTYKSPVANVKDPVSASIRTFHVTASHAGFSPNMIEVNEGDTVRLSLESIDVRHSFYIPALGVRVEIPARDTTTLEFIATQKGQFEFLSDIYSGENTGNLRGVLIVN
jgi:heme/copper-type cytochrome/quinol oxidase subunit 2